MTRDALYKIKTIAGIESFYRVGLSESGDTVMVTSTLIEHLEKLRYFVAIAEEGSIAKAAQKFHLSQPTLSHSLKTLEEVLGLKLFNRSSEGVSLTHAGEHLFYFGKRLVKEAEQVEHALKLTEELEVSTITIGTKEPYAISQWPRYMEFLQAAFPNLELVLKIGRSNVELIKQLKEEKFDLLLIPNPPEMEGIISYELFKDDFSFYISTASFEKTSLDKILKLPVYFFHNAMCGNNKTIAMVLKNETELMKRGRDVDSFNVAKSLALKGLGVALLPGSLASEDVLENRLRIIELPSPKKSAFGTLSICLCVNEKNARHAHLKAIRQALKQFHLSH